jgi:regulation of enolase protein 1 (concanavalin A-like superfamily)
MEHRRRFRNAVRASALLGGAVVLLLSTVASTAQSQARVQAGPQRTTVGQSLNAPTGAAQAYLISDDFNSPSLNTRLWSFVDPLGDGTMKTNGKQILISVPAGVAHDAWTGANNAPRILQPTNDADFEIVAKIDSPMTQQYQTSGIMVQESPTTYLRFDINSDGSVLRAFAASVVNNVASAQSSFDNIVDSNAVVPLYIAVKRTGSNWQMAWSKNDTTWYLAANFTFSIVVNAVGLFAANQGTTPPAFTAAFDFLRTGIPGQPSLISPVDGMPAQPVPAVLTWGGFPGAVAYALQVGTDSSFATGLVVNDSTSADTSRSLALLARGTRFFWRVAARNGAGGTSAWSTKRSFVTVPEAPLTPALLQPADAASDVPPTVQFQWSRAAGASAYHLQVAEDSLFSGSLVVNDSTLIDTSRSVSGLRHETRHFWRVRSVGAGGGSAFSPVRRFTTVVAPPAVTSLLSPADASTNQPTTSLFVWRHASAATQYHLQITQDSLFISGLVVNDSTITDTVKSVNILLYSSRYFWRVRARNVGGASSFTPARSFITIVGPPALLSPANNAGGQALTVNLRWGKVPRAIAYRLQMGTDSTFATGVIKNDSSIVDTTRTISGLVINQRYYWRVNARDGSGAGPFSPVWSFLTATPLPDPLALITPANEASVAGDSVRFLWRSTQPLVERYALEYAADSLFVFKIVDSTLTDTSKVVRGLLIGSRYFWRVRAKNPGGWGAYAPYWAFRTGTTVVAEERALPKEFALDQNYPNPFNPSTTISYALPNAGHVTLEVFSLLGERVGAVVDGVQEAGFHSVVFGGSALSSGVYLYRLSADGGQRVFVRKMVLMK